MHLREKTYRGFFWNFFEHFSSKFVGFFIQIILARLLMPKDFGLLAMVIVFIGIGTSIMDSGFGQSLIRTKNLTKADYSSVFFLNIIMSVVVYFLLYILAPRIANFYEEESLSLILRVLALIVIIKASYLVHKTIFTINLDFKKPMIFNVVSTMLAGIGAIILALNDFKVWSLVFFQIMNSLSLAILFWWYSDWFPNLIFRLDRVRHHFQFGYKLMIGSIVNSSVEYLFDMVIGKYYSSSQLGIYNRASTFQKFPTLLLGRSINRVTYPYFSQISHDERLMKMSLRKMNKLVVYAYTPAILFMILNARSIIVIFFTAKWIEVVPIFQMLCLGAMFQPLQYYTTNIVKALGNSGLLLKIVGVSRILVILGLLVVVRFDFWYLVYFQVLSMVFTTVLYMYFSGRMIEYHLFEQFKDISREFLKGIVISFLCYSLIYYLNLSGGMSLLAYVAMLVVMYLSLGRVFQMEAYQELEEVVNKLTRQIKD